MSTAKKNVFYFQQQELLHEVTTVLQALMLSGFYQGKPCTAPLAALSSDDQLYIFPEI